MTRPPDEPDVDDEIRQAREVTRRVVRGLLLLAVALFVAYMVWAVIAGSMITVD